MSTLPAAVSRMLQLIAWHLSKCHALPQKLSNTNQICSYAIYQGGVIAPSGGTSAAAPVTASIIALLNDARLRAGKPTLGFLNPLIYYKAYQGFTDITAGQAIGCNGNNTQTLRPVPGVSMNRLASYIQADQ